MGRRGIKLLRDFVFSGRTRNSSLIMLLLCLEIASHARGTSYTSCSCATIRFVLVLGCLIGRLCRMPVAHIVCCWRFLPNSQISRHRKFKRELDADSRGLFHKILTVFIRQNNQPRSFSVYNQLFVFPASCRLRLCFKHQPVRTSLRI